MDVVKKIEEYNQKSFSFLYDFVNGKAVLKKSFDARGYLAFIETTHNELLKLMGVSSRTGSSKTFLIFMLDDVANYLGRNNIVLDSQEISSTHFINPLTNKPHDDLVVAYRCLEITQVVPISRKQPDAWGGRSTVTDRIITGKNLLSDMGNPYISRFTPKAESAYGNVNYYPVNYDRDIGAIKSAAFLDQPFDVIKKDAMDSTDDHEIQHLYDFETVLINYSTDTEIRGYLAQMRRNYIGWLEILYFYKLISAGIGAFSSDHSDAIRYIIGRAVDHIKSNRMKYRMITGHTDVEIQNQLVLINGAWRAELADTIFLQHKKEFEQRTGLKIDKAQNAGRSSKHRIGPAFVIKSSQSPGGIDLNSANLAMMIKRDGKGVVLPLAQQDLAQLSNFEGLDPVILSIQPASQTPVFSQLKASP